MLTPDHNTGCRCKTIRILERLECNRIGQSGNGCKHGRYIRHHGRCSPYPCVDVERCRRFRRYGNRQGHTVIVGSRQRIQPVRNNTDSRQQHNNI